ncbi:MAG TPA: conjugal transfer protein TraO [Burkholderiaceae bacterium]|nr:conjugal transfer protein TraO [Burkholderiaceae bacterium]
MVKVQADIGRHGFVVAIAVVLVVAGLGYLGYTYWQGGVAKSSDIAAVRLAGRGAPSEESEHYQQVLEGYNRKNAAHAEGVGETYISVPSMRSGAVKAGVPQEAAPAPMASASPPPEPPSAPAQEPSRARPTAVDPEHNKFLEQHVQGLMTNWTAQPHGTAVVAKDAKDYAASLTHPQSPAGTPVKGHEDLLGETIVSGYDLVPATLRTNIDTDESSVVEAYIPAGPYAGARLFAPGYKRMGNSVDMTFNAMSWRGRTYKVTAKAVDEITMRSTLSGEVNNRYFSRILVPALARGLAKAGQLYEQSGTQAVVSPLGGVVVTAPESASAKAVGGTIVGGMAQQAATVLAQDAAAESVKQVLVPATTTIGIRFLALVLSTDEVTGKTPTSEAIEASARATAPLATSPQTQAQFAAQQAAQQQAATQMQTPSAVAAPAGVTPYIPRQ